MGLTPLVFLDIDGVLNNRTSMFLATKGIYPPLNPPIYTMDWGCVQMFKYLIQAASAKFVITSTWRKETVALSSNVFNALAWGGFHDAQNYCVGVTEKIYKPKNIADPLEPWCRGFEIDKWLEANPTYTNFVILDDDSADIHQQDHLVKTDHERGLTLYDV